MSHEPSTGFVSGGASGIGRAIVERLVADGMRVAVFDRDRAALKELASTQPQVAPIHGDAGEVAPALVARQVIEAVGPPTAIVNNIGVTDRLNFLDSDQASAELVLRVNLLFPWFVTQALIAAVSESELRHSSVVFISSLHAHRTRTHTAYAVSKAGLETLVREMASELGPQGVRVNAVAPGWIANPGAETPPQPQPSDIPLGAPGSPADVAEAVAFLLDGARARYVSNAVLRVDGGLDAFSWQSQRPNAPSIVEAADRLVTPSAGGPLDELSKLPLDEPAD